MNCGAIASSSSNLGPEAAVYVGDRYDLDADAARRAGLRGVWLDRRRARTPDQLSPIINGLGELRAVVEEIAHGGE